MYGAGLRDRSSGRFVATYLFEFAPECWKIAACTFCSGAEGGRMRLKDRVALITGGGTGMGRAAALLFAREGASVAINYSRSRDEAAEVVAQIRSAGGKAIAIQASVAKESEVIVMMQRVEAEFGRLDALINNAGWTQRVAHDKLDELTDEIWDQTFDVNVRGVFYCARAAAPLLRKQEGASIVNNASIAALTGSGSSIAYAAAKAAVVTMTMSLARALAPEIRVNAIAPGFVRTQFANWPAEMYENVVKKIPLQRLPTVEDIANAMLFLVADARSTTGEMILVDGGMTRLGPRA
jgi:3-oxoacyl-[acyl-carrier protein] reductase